MVSTVGMAYRCIYTYTSISFACNKNIGNQKIIQYTRILGSDHWSLPFRSPLPHGLLLISYRTRGASLLQIWMPGLEEWHLPSGVYLFRNRVWGGKPHITSYFSPEAALTASLCCLVFERIQARCEGKHKRV